MRIGYAYWGFLSDQKIKDGRAISTPDGNATYSWSIIWEMQRRKHIVFQMHEDREHEAYSLYGPLAFDSFSREKRLSAYSNLVPTFGTGLPQLDVLLVEWRWPIPGRNCDIPSNHPDFQPDLARQRQLLEYYYNTHTRVIFWDLDHKLDPVDEMNWRPHAIFETSVEPKIVDASPVRRTRVEPPILVDDLLQFPTEASSREEMLVYVGSRYERDDVIQEYIAALQNYYPNRIHFYGNWLKTIDEVKKKWPLIKYHDRITTKDFRRAYKNAVAVPLLAKNSYLKHGFVTPRVWEAILFGTIPVGLSEARGIDQYTPYHARDWEELSWIVDDFANMDVKRRDRLRRECAERIRFMDAKNFVDKIEGV